MKVPSEKTSTKEKEKREMRKLTIWLMVAALTLGLAASAAAYQVKIGATIYTNLFYAFQSGNAAGRGDSRMPDTTTFVAEASGDSFFWISWTSNDKTTGAYIELWLQGGPGHGATAVGLDYMYGWYKFGRCTLTIGHTDNLFASAQYQPYAALASFYFADGSGGNYFREFGKLYSGRFVQIKLDYEVGPWTFMVALGQAPTGGSNPVNPVGVANVANTMLPRLDVAVQYKGKMFSVAPGFSVYVSERESIEGASLEDDRVLAYALVLPFKLTFGSFGVVGEVGFGRNWVTANIANLWRQGVWWGGNNDGTQVKFEDTYTYTACLGLYYEIGRATIWLSGGWQKSTNASNDQVGTWRHGQNTRYAVVFAVPYKINKHFTIAPEVGYYFFGWDPTLDVGPGAGSMNADLGSAWLAGVQFVFSF
jgi:hypothetical protein